MNRRVILAGCVSSLTIAGCLDEGASNDPNDGELGEVSPESSPEVVPLELECDNPEFTRVDSPSGDGDLEYGDVDAFALRVDELQYEYGGNVQITLTNTSSETQYTANNRHWYFQIYTENGWQDVRGTTDDHDIDHTLDESSHSPGDGFEWEFELTEDGIIDRSPDSDRIEVCPELQDGRYRFVFWGLESSDIAVQFDVVR